VTDDARWTTRGDVRGERTNGRVRFGSVDDDALGAVGRPVMTTDGTTTDGTTRMRSRIDARRAVKTTAWTVTLVTLVVVTVVVTVVERAVVVSASSSSSFARAVETVSEGTYRANEEMRVRFTHDVEYEARAYAASAGVGGTSAGVDAVGNPGMVYARAFDARGRSTFRLGAEDALVIELERPPTDARYFSIVVYAYARGGRVMSAQGGWPVNSANARVGKNGRMVVVATRSEEAYRTVTRAVVEVDGDANAVNAQRMFDDVRSLDALSLSMRIAFWPDANARDGDVDALGEYQKLEWPAFIMRRNGVRFGGVDSSRLVPQSVPPPTIAPRVRRPTGPPPEVFIDGNCRVAGTTTLEPMRVDHRQCLSDPLYNPWSVHGVNSRSACFGATTDALYSVSRDFIRRDAVGAHFLVVVQGGTPAAATFSNVALYSTGGPLSSLISARDITILAAIDDRSFGEASSFAVAFGSSALACARVSSIPCVVARPGRRSANLFVIARDYLDTRTATAPTSRPDVFVTAYEC